MKATRSSLSICCINTNYESPWHLDTNKKVLLKNYYFPSSYKYRTKLTNKYERVKMSNYGICMEATYLKDEVNELPEESNTQEWQF